MNCSATWQLQHPQKIILVGHKFGCILIKSLIIEVNKVAHRKRFADLGQSLAEAFQHNLSGIVFYTVPHLRTIKDIQIMFQEKKDVFNEVREPSISGPSSSESHIPESTRLHKSIAWRALLHQIEAINEDFEDSIAHSHTKICVISHGLTMEKEVNSITFMLHHVLDDGHINILAFVEGHPYGKS